MAEKKLPEIAKCFCGKKADVVGDVDNNEFYCACNNPQCWTGPMRKTEQGAINAWSKVLGDYLPVEGAKL